MGIGFFPKKGINNKCAVCGKQITTNSVLDDLCQSCFDNCRYFSAVINYLQNTSISNLNVIESTTTPIEFDNRTSSSSFECISVFQENAPVAANDTGTREVGCVVTAKIIRSNTSDEYLLDHKAVKIGRSAEFSDIAIDGNSTIGRCHATITNKNNKYYISDCHSANGTFVNGNKIAADEETELNSGDEFWLSTEKFVFVLQQ